MMKFFLSKWNIFKTPLILRRDLCHSSQAPRRDSLLFRISRAGDTTLHMSRILNQWVKEGRDVTSSELQLFIKKLRSDRRYNHALQVLEWMSNERNYQLLSGDIAVRLDLIAKVHGLDPAEKYFNSISDSARDFKTYGALLNCYVQHNSMEKAEAILQKLKEYASEHPIDLSINYNALLRLYAQVGQYEKMDHLMQEMKDKAMRDSFTFHTRLNAFVAAKDIDGMEKLLLQMEHDPKVTINWTAYAAAANGYLKAGKFENSFAMLRKSEQLIQGMEGRAGYESLLTAYAAIGKRDDVYRIWDMLGDFRKSYNSCYLCMISALKKLDDVDGAEKILQEWESGNRSFDLRIPNQMVTAYCQKGLLEKAEAYVERLLKRGHVINGSVWERLARGYYCCNDMDNAVQTMKKAILTTRRRSSWKPHIHTWAACIEHMKDKGNLELASEILNVCLERGYMSTATYDRLLSYVRGEISETNAINLINEYYFSKTHESLPDGKKQHVIQLQR